MKEKEILVPVFNAQILLFYGEHVDIESRINERFAGINYENNLFQFAQYMPVNTGEDIYLCIMLFPESSTEHVYHESLHASYDILDKLGIYVTPDNHEILAYLMGYIANTILETLKQWKDG